MRPHEFKNCRYCADDVDVSYLEKHEAKCKTQTPEERKAEQKKRKYAREAYRQKHGMAVPTRKKRGPYKKRHSVATLASNGHWINGTGKRLSATISIDFKSFREVLLQLAPMLSIDKVEVL